MTDTTNEDDTTTAPSCLGTKTISLRDQGGKKEEGLLAVFRESDDSLQLSITNGKAVYHGTIPLKEVKMTLLDSLRAAEKLKTLAGYLLDQPHEQVKASYSLQGGTLQVSIRFQTSATDDEDAQTKKAWGGTLVSSNDLFGFYKTLSESINQEQRRLGTLQDQIKVTRQERDGWKTTAEKLEGAWQTEKDAVFQNFVRLYNATMQELTKTKTELQAALADQDEDDGSKKKRSKKQSTEETVLYPDQPDDHDRDVFDPDLVQAMAKGEKVSLATNRAKLQASKKPAAKRRKEDSSSDDSDGPPRKKRPAAKRAKAKADYSSDNSDDSPPPRKKKAKGTPEAAAVPEYHEDSDSSTERFLARIKQKPESDSD